MRRLVLVVGGVLLLLILLVVGGLQAVKTQAVRDRISSALSRALGQPATIGDLTVSLLPSPALTARAVRIGRSDPGSAYVSPDLPWAFALERFHQRNATASPPFLSQINLLHARCPSKRRLVPRRT